MARQERERRYISEVMKEFYPDMNWQLNVELGPVPEDYVKQYGMKRAAALFRPTRPRVDAVHWTPETYYLIEAKLRDIKNGIGDLMYYRAQAEKTLDMPYYVGQPIKCILFIPWMIEWMREAATAAGVEVRVVSYPWIEDYIEEKKHYFTAEYRAERQEKMRLREILGVE